MVFIDETEDFLKQLGARLRHLRILRGDTQAIFAQRIDVSIPTLRAMESGAATVQIGIWIRAVCVLNRMDDLVAVLEDRRSLFDRLASTKTARRRAKKRGPP